MVPKRYYWHLNPQMFSWVLYSLLLDVSPSSLGAESNSTKEAEIFFFGQRKYFAPFRGDSAPAKIKYLWQNEFNATTT